MQVVFLDLEDEILFLKLWKRIYFNKVDFLSQRWTSISTSLKLYFHGLLLRIMQPFIMRTVYYHLFIGVYVTVFTRASPSRYDFL